MTKRTLLATALVAVSMTGPAFAGFPDRPIQIVIPYSAGGSTDLSMRLLAESFKRNVPGATMVVRNQPGGGGSIGTSATIHARPDGYTLGAGAQGPLALMPHLGGTDYQIQDVDYVGMMSRSLQLLVACKGAPFSTYDAFMTYAKKSEPQIGNSGAGGANHISAEAFAKAAGIKVKSVPFGGSSKARTACIGGHIDAMVASPAEALAQSQAGNMTPLFVMEDKRIDLFPDTPTAVEKGVNFTWSSWKGLIAPKGIPDKDMKILRDGFAKAVADKKFQEQMKEMGELTQYEDAVMLKARVQKDSEAAESVIRDLGMYGMNK
ncbi:MAG: tripartite tricarboxylate transporter substrate binding protein [Rhodospirillaceae bacterium]|nr:tripartite tricarboxylate transporter substrate binding protein [Rhodospirillaceae bacterium]